MCPNVLKRIGAVRSSDSEHVRTYLDVSVRDLMCWHVADMPQRVAPGRNHSTEYTLISFMHVFHVQVYLGVALDRILDLLFTGASGPREP